MVRRTIGRAVLASLPLLIGAGGFAESKLATPSPVLSVRADTSKKKTTKPLLGTPARVNGPIRTGGLRGEPVRVNGPIRTGGLLGDPARSSEPARASGLLGEPARSGEPARASGLIGEPAGARTSGLLGSPAASQVGGDGGLLGTPVRHTFGSFTQAQLENERVLAARIEKRFALKQLFKARGLEYPAAELFFRIFKRERQLEVWARDIEDQTLTHLKTYSICALAGQLGPKRSLGDNQTPEGIYYIDSFNPVSGYHLSLHLDYPNKSDRILTTSDHPGGNIFIHGGCQTEGCLAVTDDAIKELYWMAVETRDAGQRRIPVHIFPARLTDGEMDQLVRAFANEPHLHMFWANLKPVYEFFEATKRVPMIDIDGRGRYQVLDTEKTPAQVKSAATASVRGITSE